jgi:hypothetical protein
MVQLAWGLGLGRWRAVRAGGPLSERSGEMIEE